MKINLMYYLILIILTINCNGQSQEKDSCINDFNNAEKLITDFAIKRDSTALNSALQLYGRAMNCSETRKKSIEKMILYINLSEDYQKGYSFIESLLSNDFDKPYKKKMYMNFYKAMEYDKKENILERDKYFSLIADSIQLFIQKSNLNELEEEAYYDLYFIKSKYLSKEVIENEINELIKSNPKNKLFFDSLKYSLFSIENEEVSAPKVNE